MYNWIQEFFYTLSLWNNFKKVRAHLTFAWFQPNSNNIYFYWIDNICIVSCLFLSITQKIEHSLTLSRAYENCSFKELVHSITSLWLSKSFEHVRIISSKAFSFVRLSNNFVNKTSKKYNFLNLTLYFWTSDDTFNLTHALSYQNIHLIT
jgi:hypothetical protein